MAPAEGRRFFKMLSKPLLLFPCCGSTSHVSEPGAGNRVSPEEPDTISRRDTFRPAALETGQASISRSEEASDTHPYHCPICFYFFNGESPRQRAFTACLQHVHGRPLTCRRCLPLAEMNRTICCKHHLCSDCASEIMERIPAFRAGYEAETVREMEPAPCPHCGTENLRLTPIRTREEARNYSDSPALPNRSRGQTPGRQSNSVQPSPLKVGDSMENMMRKMLTYEQCGINITAHQRISVVGDTTTPGRDSPPLDNNKEDSSNPSALPGVPFPPLPEDRALEPRESAAPAPQQAQHDGGGQPREGGEPSGRVPSEGTGSQERERENLSLSGSGALRPLPAVRQGSADVGGGTGAAVAGRPPLPGARGLGASRSRSHSLSPLPSAAPPRNRNEARDDPEADDALSTSQPLPQAIAWEVHS